MKEAFVGLLVFVILKGFFDFIDQLPSAASWVDGIYKLIALACLLGSFFGLCWAIGYGSIWLVGLLP